MKILPTVQLLLLLAFGAIAHADPSATGEPAGAERVKSLETRLAAARQEVARLEAELAAAKTAAHSRHAVTHGERKQLAPAASTLLQEKGLRHGDVRSITRIAGQVPSLLFGQTGNETRFAIRGAYTAHTGPGSEPLVGIFEDGVPVTTTSQALGPYVDVREIEVLRGPQGVEYGRYAFGGVVEVRSNEPDPGAWDTSLRGTIASSDLTRFEAMLNIPVAETLAIRLAGASESFSGYVNNYVLEESDADDLKTRAQQYVRMAIKWQATEDLGLRLNFVSLDQNGSGSGVWGYQQVGAMIGGQYLPGHHFAPPGETPDHGPWDIARNMSSLAELENLSTTLALDWRLDFANLEWRINKSKFESLQVFDGDYSNGGNPYDSDFNGWDSHMDTVSSDLALSSPGQGPVDWVAGLHYLEREADWGWLATYDNVHYRPDWDATGDYLTDSVAAYANLGYRPLDRLRLFAGLRWHEDSKRSRNGDVDRWDGLLWSAGAEYEFSDTMSAYLKASTAYRPGGLNETPGVTAAYNAENVTAYEAGYETRFADDTVSLNLTAFLHDYEDLQTQAFTHLPLPGGPVISEYLATAGGKTSRGVEAELAWTPDNGWDIAANFAWLDAEFRGFAIPALAGLGSPLQAGESSGLLLDGSQPAFSPDWMAGLRVAYSLDLGNWGKLQPMFQTRFIADYYSNDLNLPGTLQKAHGVSDLRLFWRLPGDRVSMQLYIENLSVEEVLQATTVYNPVERPDIATILAGWGDPRKYGLILSWRY